MNKQILVPAAICCTIFSVSACWAAEEDDAAEEAADGAIRCIDTRRISRTHVVDDQTILFYMRGGPVYVNNLPRKCPSLRREKKFSYRTSISRLCDVDMITVLYDAGTGLSRGPSCGLGRFNPISEEEAKALKAGPDAEIEAAPLPPADPEEPEVRTPDEDTGE